jgi:hypothetical protein
MSQVIKVDRKIDFQNNAAHASNVYGNMKEARKHFHDGFYGDTLSTDNWLATLDGTGDTIAVTSVSGGAALITTGSGDTETTSMAGPTIWSGTKKACAEARITITDVSGCAVFFGLTDATYEAATYLPIDYSGNALRTTASNGTGFVIDSASTTLGTSHILCTGVTANSDATTKDTAITWADTEIKTLRLELDSTTARFWVDGVSVGTVALATTAATLLCVFIGVANREAAANTVYVHRVDVWQDE